MISSALIHDPSGRVLCVNPAYKETWHLPGGTVEAGESPAEACARECQEELGVVNRVGRLLAVGHIPPGPDDPHGAMAFVYDVSLKTWPSRFDLPEDELEDAAWLTSTQRHERLSALALLLASGGLEAIEAGEVIELDRLP
ncbi:NUDIX domain-containing protein [Brachybacterium sp. AOP43-C2-M15]|uniref:NUDIX domain-containing protein n=1 Tax=Brachybacterium sp. AOP43-C2-M15 TaxID=3457661 RepID=UPI004033DE9E